MIMKIVIEMRYYTILYKRVRTGFFGANAPGVRDTFDTPVYANSNLISFPQTDNTITLDNILTSKQLQT